MGINFIYLCSSPLTHSHIHFVLCMRLIFLLILCGCCCSLSHSLTLNIFDLWEERLKWQWWILCETNWQETTHFRYVSTSEEREKINFIISIKCQFLLLTMKKKRCKRNFFSVVLFLSQSDTQNRYIFFEERRRQRWWIASWGERVCVSNTILMRIVQLYARFSNITLCDAAPFS